MESNKMTLAVRIFFIIAILSKFLLSNPLPPLDKEISKGKELIYQFELSRAVKYFDSLTSAYPEHPIPYFYKGYIKLIIYSQDMVNEALMNELIDDFKNCVNKTEQVPNYDQKARLLYYLGLSYGAIGIRYALDQSYIKAYWFGRKGKHFLEKAAELDSTFYDVYLGLGIYHYYIGLMPGIVKFFARLLGFSGNKEKGLQEIALCARKGAEFRIEAQLAYEVLRYFMQNELHRIYNIARLGQLYPRNPVIPMLVGYHYRRTGYPERAIPYFESISDDVNIDLPQLYQMKYYNLAVCKYLMNDFNSMYRILNTFLLPQTKKMTEYYQSALNYYLGIYLLVMGKSDQGIEYLKKIPDKHHTSFWYLTAEPFIHYPVPPVFQDIIKFKNNVFSHRLSNKLLIEKIETYYSSYPKDFWYYYYLDSKGLIQYLTGNYQSALKIFNHLNHRLQKFDKAKYFRKWVLMHHGRTYAKLGHFDQAESLVRSAMDINDDYIKFIAQRELYIIQKAKQE